MQWPHCGLSWKVLGLKSQMRDIKIKLTFTLRGRKTCKAAHGLLNLWVAESKRKTGKAKGVCVGRGSVTLPGAALHPHLSRETADVWMLLVLAPGLSQQGTFLGHTRMWKRGCSPSKGPVRLLGSSCEVLEGDECGSSPRWGFGDGGRRVMAALGESCWKCPRGLLQKAEPGVGVDVVGFDWEGGGNL